MKTITRYVKANKVFPFLVDDIDQFVFIEYKEWIIRVFLWCIAGSNLSTFLQQGVTILYGTLTICLFAFRSSLASSTQWTVGSSNYQLYLFISPLTQYQTLTKYYIPVIKFCMRLIPVDSIFDRH